jgi:arginine decarboxylase
LTELGGLDVLSAPTGPIAAAQALAADACGAGATRFCVNGSTGGLAAAVAAAVAAWRGRQRAAGAPLSRPPLLLAARNCHASVYAAAAGAGAEVGWIPAPPAGGPPPGQRWPGVAHPVTPAGLAAALTASAAAGHPPPAAVVLVSPTYFGAVADITALADVAHPAPLIVDEAHGPHFGAHPSAFLLPAIRSGATLSVSSAHKVLAALGQAALVHVAAGAPPGLLASLDTALTAQQTSSPSYLLLASLDAARAAAFEGGGSGWEAALDATRTVRAALRAAPGVRLLCDEEGDGPFAWDPLRVTFALDTPHDAHDTLAPRSCCGLGVAAALEGAGVVVEAALPGGAVVLAGGAGTGPAAAGAVVAALPALLAARDGGRLPLAPLEPAASQPSPPFLPPAAVSPRDALYGGLATEAVPLALAAGRVAAEALTPYPPGVPAVLPGEILSRSTLAHLRAVLAAGGRVAGAADPGLASVRVFVDV